MIRDPSDGTVKPTLPTLKRLREKYGPNWGLNADEKRKRPPQPAPTSEELASHYSEFNLAFRPKQKMEAE